MVKHLFLWLIIIFKEQANLQGPSGPSASTRHLRPLALQCWFKLGSSKLSS